MSYYGYARVSTREQNLLRQIKALKNFGVKEDMIFADKLSGKDFNRPEYIRMIKKLRRGDAIVVKSIDRLGRNYNEIIDQWQRLVKNREIDIVVLDMPLLDTRDKSGDLTGTLISDLVLQILSYVAQTERDYIKQRQAEGIAIAQDKGVKFGRPNRDVPVEFESAKIKYLNGDCTSREAASLCDLSQTTFLRWVHKKNKKF